MPKDDEAVKEAPEAAKETEGIKENTVEVPPTEPDWKELLRLERDRAETAERDRDNYKEGLLSHKRREKQQRDEAGDDVDEKIKRTVQEALSPVVEALQGSRLEQVLTSVVTDPAKRAYVRELYNSRIQRTGTSDEAIRTDIEAALTLADANRISKENTELKRMNDNRTYVPPNAGGGSQDKPTFSQKAHQWTPEQAEALERRAMSAGITDVEKFKANAWQQFQKGTAFAVQKKPKT